ncbi:MAG TPA: hypothetical protein VMU52_04565, partial [Steroidobacteraceae bacterium]|nr:hypothetical protein [Steroidobacteraceae bacterium]
MVVVSAQRAVAKGLALLPLLDRGEGDVMLVRGRHLCPRRMGYHPSGSTVEADMRITAMIRVGARVDVGYEGWSNMDDGAVVHEYASTPVSACEADAVISKAVVHAAVESDVRPPVAGMP